MQGLEAILAGFDIVGYDDGKESFRTGSEEGGGTGDDGLPPSGGERAGPERLEAVAPVTGSDETTHSCSACGGAKVNLDAPQVWMDVLDGGGVVG